MWFTKGTLPKMALIWVGELLKFTPIHVIHIHSVHNIDRHIRYSYIYIITYRTCSTFTVVIYIYIHTYINQYIVRQYKRREQTIPDYIPIHFGTYIPYWYQTMPKQSRPDYF